jgi:ABC-type transport system involved in multi-copper enzyme maturation permease subunit
MKSKNLIILSAWSAVTVIFALLIILGASYSNNPEQWLLTMFDDWLIVFLVTLIFTGIVAYLVKEPEVNLQLDLQNIGTKLDSLTKEVAEIKKAIED